MVSYDILQESKKTSYEARFFLWETSLEFLFFRSEQFWFETFFLNYNLVLKKWLIFKMSFSKIFSGKYLNNTYNGYRKHDSNNSH